MPLKTFALAILALAVSLVGAFALADGLMDPNQPTTTAPVSAATAPAIEPPSAAEFPVRSDTVTDDQVLAAINKGVDYLLSQRQGDNFEHGGYAAGGATNRGGETAIVVYALLHVVESVSDDAMHKKINFASPDLAPVITYLKNVQPDGTYTAALLASALTLLPKTSELTAALEQPRGVKNYLIRATNDNGGYEYTMPGAALDAKVAAQEDLLAELRAKLAAPGKKDPADVKTTQDQIKQALDSANKLRTDAEKQKAQARQTFHPDGSNTQYGVLGAWALCDYGLAMPPGYWLAQDKYWRKIETPEGAFPYSPSDPQSMRDTMVCAGLATLFITQEFIDLEPRLTPKKDPQMEAAISNISDSFLGSSSDQYYDYGIERVGLASGLKFFGNHDWYRELAQTLVKSQNPNGSWNAGFYHASGNGLTIATSYALLTLARGRNPVLVNKLSYKGPWNARSRDAARLTEHLAKSFERPLNWQVVSELIAPENWMDAPILLITGSQDPKFPPDVVAKLKAYVEMGGIIFSSADGDKSEFTDAIKKYAAQIAPGRQMQPLPANSPLFNGELWTKVANPPKLLALSNGVRLLWVHSAGDMGATWHKKDSENKPNWDIPGNLYFYATGKSNLKSRLQSPVVMAPAIVPGPTLTLGRLMLGEKENPDPEPGAWPRMARLMRTVCQTNVQIKTITLADLPKIDPPLPAIHLTGTTAFTVSDADITILRNYLSSGGTLIADAAGMSPPFTSSFMQLSLKLYPKTPLTPIPANSPLYLGPFPPLPGTPATPSPAPAPSVPGLPPTPTTPAPPAPTTAKAIREVRYRLYYNLKHGLQHTPHLQAVQTAPNGRYLILFSEEDLTSGLLGTNTWGIAGYTPESAQALARNILLYTLAHAPPASTQPAAPTTTPPATQPGKSGG